MKKALFYGILASFFFAFTFLLNRSMHLAGGYWLWSVPPCTGANRTSQWTGDGSACTGIANPAIQE